MGGSEVANHTVHGGAIPLCPFSLLILFVFKQSDLLKSKGLKHPGTLEWSQTSSYLLSHVQFE